MSESEGQIKRLVLTAVDECALCGQEYSPDDVDIIGSRGSLWVLMLHCPRCRKRGFIAALLNGPDSRTVLPIDEGLPAAAAAAAISAHDVLEMREFLATFSGDLSHYLDRPASDA